MKILHCIYDDKFMDGTIRVYASDERHVNRYVYVYRKGMDTDLVYTKYPDVTHVEERDFLSLAKEYDVVILHSLKCVSQKAIASIPDTCKVVWYGWGFDLYNGYNAPIKIELLDRKTRHFMWLHQLNKLPKKIIRFPLRPRNKRLLKKALMRIDYFSGVFPFEYELLRESRPYVHARKLDFYYGDTDFFVKKEIDTSFDENRKDIILGNSGDPSNNHNDAIQILKEIKLPKESRLIIPMSYGGTESYRSWVKSYAEKCFPLNAFVLSNFMPLKEYLEVISKCQAAIFFHERQQASDNILMQLMYGAKVYLSDTCQTYHYLKEVGFIVYSLQKEWSSIMEPMKREDVMINRKLLAELYSAETIVDRVRKINTTIEEDIKQENLKK